MGTRPVFRRGGETARRYCPRCRDLRNFSTVTWQNYFALFFIPLFPLGRPEAGCECVSCRAVVGGAEAAARPEPGPWTAVSPALPPGESLAVQCPRCDGRMRVPLRERGFTATCPHCTLRFKVNGQRESIPEATVEEE